MKEADRGRIGSKAYRSLLAYPNPMTAPTPPETPTVQASPDELAALYLRSRDTPCPECGYNRRDGLTAACPECDRKIRIVPSGTNIDPRTGRTASVVSMVIACVAALCCGAAAMLIASNGPAANELVAVALLFATLCAAIVAMNRAVSTRLPDGQRYLRQFLEMLGVSSVLYAVGMLVLLWDEIF